MKKKVSISMLKLIGLMVTAILVLAILPSQAQAAMCGAPVSDPAGDYDCDGITNGEELAGITLADGAFVPNCEAATGGEPFGCLDPTKMDLFVIMLRATPTLIPVNPLVAISKSRAENGLGVVTHEIGSAQGGVNPDKPRTITLNQNALRVTESHQLAVPDDPATDVDETDDKLGVANFGNPNGLDRATVYTKRIKDHVESVYDTVDQLPPTGLIDNYIRQIIVHEIGHMINLSAEYNERFGGNHYKAGTGVIMEQSVKYTKKGSNVTFYVSTDFADPSQTSTILTEDIF